MALEEHLSAEGGTAPLSSCAACEMMKPPPSLPLRNPAVTPSFLRGKPASSKGDVTQVYYRRTLGLGHSCGLMALL